MFECVDAEFGPSVMSYRVVHANIIIVIIINIILLGIL